MDTTLYVPATSGPCGRCAEAQADGVPCAGLGTDCEFCGRALPPELAGSGSLPATAASLEGSPPGH
jgi:hypothetical protein